MSLLFNLGKCKCLHTGHWNLDVNYKMGDTVLGTTVKERDLGVTISADMKVSEQCGIAASKGNQIIGLIRRNITYKGKKLIIPLYNTIVRPHLEYCIQAWRPYRKKDISSMWGHLTPPNLARFGAHSDWLKFEMERSDWSCAFCR